MDLEFGQCDLNTLVMISSTLCEFLSEGMSVVWCHISMFRCETGSCFNFNVHYPISTKLHMFAKSPGLNTYTCQEITSFILWSTPLSDSSDSLSGWPHSSEIWSEDPLDIVDNRLWMLCVFIKSCYCGNMPKDDVCFFTIDHIFRG